MAVTTFKYAILKRTKRAVTNNFLAQVEPKRVAPVFFFGAIFSFLTILISSILYSLTNPFTILTNWVSNLGIGPNGSALIFNYGLMIMAIMYFFMTTYILVHYKEKTHATSILIKLSAICGYTAVIGIFLLTTHPMGTELPYHATGAYMFFLCTPFFTGFSTGAIKSITNEKMRTQLIVVSMEVALSILIIPVALVALSNSNNLNTSMLNSMDPTFKWVRLLEWIAIELFFLWIFVMGKYLKRTNEKI